MFVLLTMPEISIIVPVYNVAPYLRECMDSLIGQTFRDIEIICIDDDSTDDSPSILAEYTARDRRVKVLTQHHCGLSTARNAGLAVATAPFIMFCDSDDWYAPTMCEKMYAAIQGRADMAMCGSREVADEEWHITSGEYFDLPAEDEVDVNDDILMRCNACAWNKIYHRDILEREQIRFPDGLYFEDEYFFTVYTAYVRRIAFVPDKLYYYRRRVNSIMGRVMDRSAGYTADYVRVANRIWLYHEERGMVTQRLPYLTNIWLKLCAGALHMNTTSGRCDGIEKEMIPFAKTHIAPCKGIPFVAGQRLKLLMEHRWIGMHRHLGGLVMCRCKERVSADGITIKRKYYLMGIPCWSHRQIIAETGYLSSQTVHGNVHELRKRILFCVSKVVMGGVAKVLLQYLSAIEQLGGYECDVVSTEPVEDEYFLSFFKDHGIGLHVLREKIPNRNRRDILSKLVHKYRQAKAKRAAKREINELLHQYDVLINFEVWVQTFNVYARRRRQRWIVFCHESFMHCFTAFANRELLDRYDRIVCLSHAFEHDFKQQFPDYADKIACIYNPLNVGNLREAAKQVGASVAGAFFVAVQRLDRFKDFVDKDVPIIIRAFRIFHEQYPEYRLAIVGDGSMRQELEQLAAPEVEDGSIIFTGSLSNPYPLIRDAVALILSSARDIGEGFGQVLVEAQALGVPAVSSDVPSGPAEILLHGDAGYLFEVGNPTSLAQAMLRIVESPVERENKVRRATDALDRFAPELCARKLLQLIYKT